MNTETTTCKAEFAQRFTATRRGGRLARHLAVQQLDAWGYGYGTQTSETVAHIVGELAANAAIHGRVPGRDFELRLLLRESGALRIEVSDTRSERLPPLPEPAPDGESGRGLLLVAALADAWGVTLRQVGKTVWAELAL
ncbi:ATP-binding protein [Streptomyces xantholiticus]|uniref:ATP-binding protein n=1 Tax=Streptomyces xantholiticus TaxID=68285 RepID=UPI0016776B90|nr:ATP-binding protein [Streptomyces xantholiticus]GGW58643.1 ATP-binding protein [Streptomyces xantholiticus]